MGDPWFNNFRPASRADAEFAFAAWLRTQPIEPTPPAPPRIPPEECPFDRFTTEQLQEWGRKGGLHTRTR